jgi:hypothetical protein
MGNTISSKEETIKIPGPFHPIHKIDKLLNILNKSGEQISQFIGYTTVEQLFYIYLLKKYKNHCLLFDSTTYLNITINLKKNYVTNPQITIFKKYAKQVCNCINKNMDTIIMPFSLNFEKEIGSHANVMIYRKRTNQIEHFEPHGGNFRGSTKHTYEYNNLIYNNLVALTAIINKCLKTNSVTFVHSSNICLATDFARNGFQSLEENCSIAKIISIEGSGYCAAWSMFFTELCLRNPKYSSKELIEIIDIYFKEKKTVTGIEDLKIYLRKVIRGYANFINEKILKYFSVIIGEDITIANLKLIIETRRGDLTITRINTMITDLIELDNSNYGLTLTTYEKLIKKLNIDIKTNDKKLRLEKSVANAVLIVEEGEDLLRRRHFAEMMSIRKREKYENFKISSPSDEDGEKEDTLVVKIIEKAIQKDEARNPQIKACPAGKVLNPLTNRCINIKIKKIKTVKICPPGKILNRTTGRCINIKMDKVKTIKLCPPGKVLNPKTNRCININVKTRKNV